MRRTGLTGERLGGALGLVLQFVYGFALAESQWQERVRASGLQEDELNRVVRGVAERADARFLDNADLLPPTEDGGLRASRDSQFEAGLDIALAGIDATVAAQREVLSAERGRRIGGRWSAGRCRVRLAVHGAGQQRRLVPLRAVALPVLDEVARRGPAGARPAAPAAGPRDGRPSAARTADREPRRPACRGTPRRSRRGRSTPSRCRRRRGSAGRRSPRTSGASIVRR
ncbi:TetR/AcrR family transcriptional regulator C-terminal domain-containing protein [Kitasatospora arboriphila]